MKIQFLIYAIVLLPLVSCKKDNDMISPIYNKWTYVSGGLDLEEDFQHLKYIIIQADNTVSLLYEYDHGIRGCNEDLCQVTNGQIYLFGYYLFNFTVDGNTMILQNPDEEIIFERNGNEPSKQEWIQPVEITESYNAPIESGTDLAFDGEFLWYGNGANYDDPAYLYKIDPASLSVIEQLPTSNWAIGIEWADGYLWTSSNGHSSIYKVNPVTGSNLLTSVNMGGWINGIAFDGQYLWVGDSYHKIYKYNPGINTVEEEIPIEFFPDGMAYVQNYLYICVGGIINKCTTDPFQFVAAYDIERGYICGIAHDGNDFYISAYLNNETPCKICKISL